LVTNSIARGRAAVQVDQLLADVQRDAAGEGRVVLHVRDRGDVDGGAGDPGGVDQRGHEPLLPALDRDLQARAVGGLGGEAGVGTGDLDPGRTEGLGDELDRSVHVLGIDAWVAPRRGMEWWATLARAGPQIVRVVGITAQAPR
jgi:hypothetical protein